MKYSFKIKVKAINFYNKNRTIKAQEANYQ